MIGHRAALKLATFYACHGPIVCHHEQPQWHAHGKRYVYGYRDPDTGRWAYTWTFLYSTYRDGQRTRELQPI